MSYRTCPTGYLQSVCVCVCVCVRARARAIAVRIARRGNKRFVSVERQTLFPSQRATLHGEQALETMSSIYHSLQVSMGSDFE
jgi:hypothetical protein